MGIGPVNSITYQEQDFNTIDIKIAAKINLSTQVRAELFSLPDPSPRNIAENPSPIMKPNKPAINKPT